MSAADTLKQAAQALRRAQHLYGTNDPQAQEAVAFAAALEAMAEQKPAAHMYPSDLERFQKTETIGHAYSVAVLCQEERSVPLYAAPIATPEHDAQVRNAALEAAIQICWQKMLTADAIPEIRALKTTGGAA